MNKFVLKKKVANIQIDEQTIEKIKRQVKLKGYNIKLFTGKEIILVPIDKDINFIDLINVEYNKGVITVILNTNFVSGKEVQGLINDLQKSNSIIMLIQDMLNF